MGDLVPVKPNTTLPVANTEHTARRDLPLGTAQWYQPGRDGKPAFRMGDFWVSRTQFNEPVGIGDDRHVLIASGTRAGKGISVIIPNLALWPGSVFVLDPKGENARVTARRRGNGSRYCWGLGQKVRILDPFGEVRNEDDDFSNVRVRFNPIALLSADNPHSVDDAGRIADAVVVSESANDPFWEDSACMVVKTVSLHVATARHLRDNQRTLVTVREFIVAGDTALRDRIATSIEGEPPSPLVVLFRSMIRNPAFGGVITQAGEMLLDLAKNAPRLLGSILQVARTNLDFVASPPMRDCLSASDFDLSELKTNPQGTSLYLCLPQRYTPDHFRWLRMMTTLVLGEMERIPEQPACGHPVLMMLDEFPALKRMRSIENAAAQIAGFGVKMVFVTQALAQLKDIYKDNWETFVANAGVKLFFGNDDHFTRDYVSKLVGECEVIRDLKSQSRTDGTSFSRTNGFSSTTGSSYTYGYSGSGGYSSGGASSSAGFSSSSTHSSSFTESSSATNGVSQSRTKGVSETVQRRALITPDEVGRLFGDRDNPAVLALVSGKQPMFLKRGAYYSDEDFCGYYDVHRDHDPPETIIDLTFRRLKANLEREQAEARRRAEAEANAAQVRAFEAARAAEQARAMAQAEAKALARRQKIRRAIIWGGLTLVLLCAASPIITSAILYRLRYGHF